MPRVLSMADRSSRHWRAVSQATAPPAAGAGPRCTRTGAGWRRESSSVPFAFAVLEERLDAVIVQPRFVPHVSGFDPQRAAARLVAAVQRRRPKEIVEGI